MFCQDRTIVMVDAPFLGVCAAVHMEEVMNAIGTEDPLGLRERLLVMYDRPRFARAAALRDACAAIPAATLHGFLANHFWNLHVVHHPAHPPKERFTRDLNYNWLHYTFAADAATLFWDNFDERASEQEAAYRVDQQAAKRAGKGKTRHFRLALPLHNLVQACNGVAPDNWSFEISLQAAQASLAFSTWMDSIFATLDLLRAAPPPSVADPAAAARPAAPSDLRSILACTTMPSLLAAGIHPAHLRTMMLAVLESQKKPILRHNDVLHLRSVLALNLEDRLALAHALRALRALDLLGLGVLTRSTNATGTKVLWFTKRPPDDWRHVALQVSRTALQLPPDFPFASWTLERLREGRMKSQTEISFPDLDGEDVRRTIAGHAESWRQLLGGQRVEQAAAP